VNRRLTVLTLGLAALLCGALWAKTLSLPPASFQAAAPEYDIKAAQLHLFAQFTEWPDQAPGMTPDEIRFGVLGSDAAMESMERVLKNKTVGGKRLKIIQGKAPADLKNCALVFITDSEKEQIPALLAAFKRLPILTVGESDGFARHGGILNFRIDKNKVKYEVNPSAAARAALKVTRLIPISPWPPVDDE
jgi:hypothetical protein